jgi:hypothetical protein
MSHALRIEDVNAIEPDPHLAFAHLVNGLVPDTLVAMKIKAAAALYAGKCTARALGELGTQVPRFAERDNPLAPVPTLVSHTGPANATIEFRPMTPDSETPCPNDDASTATSSTTSNPTAPDDAHDASQQPPQHANADPAAANEDSAGTSPDAKPKTSATSAPHDANAQAAHGAAGTAASPSPKPTRRRLGTR